MKTSYNVLDKMDSAELLRVQEEKLKELAQLEEKIREKQQQKSREKQPQGKLTGLSSKVEQWGASVKANAPAEKKPGLFASQEQKEEIAKRNLIAKIRACDLTFEYRSKIWNQMVESENKLIEAANLTPAKINATKQLEPIYAMRNALNERKPLIKDSVEDRLIDELTKIIDTFEVARNVSLNASGVNEAYKTAVISAKELVNKKEYQNPSTTAEPSFTNLFRQLANAIKKMIPSLGKEKELTLTKESAVYKEAYKQQLQSINDIKVPENEPVKSDTPNPT
jgi:hypothetical protein